MSHNFNFEDIMSNFGGFGNFEGFNGFTRMGNNAW